MSVPSTRWHRRLCGENLEARTLLSAVPFSDELLINQPADAIGFCDAAIGDIDGDQDLDIVAANLRENNVAWFDNIDGQGDFGPQKIIAQQVQHAHSVATADLDGDGDLDVLCVAFQGNKIAWYENTDSRGAFGAEQVIYTHAEPIDVIAADIDGDGDMDVVSASGVNVSSDTIAWHENIDGSGSFATRHIRSGDLQFAFNLALQAVDLDSDGDLDLLSTGPGNTAWWYENSDGLGAFAPRVLAFNVGVRPWTSTSPFAADLDGDGDQDVVAAPREAPNLIWYENTDGAASFAAGGLIHVPSAGGDKITKAFAANLDGDGDQDLVCVSISGELCWLENTDGAGTFVDRGAFAEHYVAQWGTILPADVDGDGDLDVLSTDDNSFAAWYENTDSAGTFGPQQIVNQWQGDLESPNWLIAADLDGDGDQDVLAASSIDDKIAWYENTDGTGTFGVQQLITTQADGPVFVCVTDVDSDGDPDVLSASRDVSTIAWFENADGAAAFGPQQVVTTLAVGARSVHAADLDGDGDHDVLSASFDWDADIGTIAWYENTNGEGGFGPQQLITTVTDQLESVCVVDLDDDGDQDVLSAWFDYDAYVIRIAWYENTDGAGAFGPQRVITTQAGSDGVLHASDLDGDGDRDVLSTFWHDGVEPFISTIAWYENTDGMGAFGPQQLITTQADRPRCVYAADLDGDGDQDTLSASSRDDKIAWYENIDGAGAFGPQQVITTQANEAKIVRAADINGDGHVDVLSATSGGFLSRGKIAWYRNESVLPPAADFDSDGDVDGDDFIRWQIGFGGFPNGGATLADGDADGDGDVDGDDFLIWQAEFGGGSIGSAAGLAAQSQSDQRQSAADHVLTRFRKPARPVTTQPLVDEVRDDRPKLASARRDDTTRVLDHDLKSPQWRQAVDQPRKLEPQTGRDIALGILFDKPLRKLNRPL